MIEAFLLGISLGLAAGLSPGPMLALVLRESLRHGAAAGIRVALAPLLTDGPVVLLAWLFARHLPPSDLRGMGIFAGAWLVHQGVRGLRAPAEAMREAPPAGLRDAVVTNLLNPHVYAFWLGVGVSVLGQLGPAAPFFLLGFYLALVGAKVALALGVGRVKSERLARFGDLLLVLAGSWLFIRSLL